MDPTKIYLHDFNHGFFHEDGIAHLLQLRPCGRVFAFRKDVSVYTGIPVSKISAWIESGTTMKGQTCHWVLTRKENVVFIYDLVSARNPGYNKNEITAACRMICKGPF
jgi:hypothetical protein